MKSLHPQFVAMIAAATVVIACISNQPLLAQPGQTSEPGVIRIKVTEALAAKLQGRKFSKSSTGEVITGIPGLDQKNRQFKVKRFKRLFRDGGEYEARHRKHGLHLWYEVTMNKGSSVSDAVRAYRADKDILKAEPVYKKTINGSHYKSFGPVIVDPETMSQTPILINGSNDPMLGSQWHYYNNGQTGGTQGADISLFDAWKIETGVREVIVAITDGGIQTDHPDLAANMWVNEEEIAGNNIDDDHNGFIDDRHGYSFVHNSGTIQPDNHGTHVAGTIAAVSNNGLGVAGVAGGSGTGDGVRLMSCAVFSDYADPTGFPESYVYAADNGAVISQNSWGYSYPGVYEESVLAAIDYFIAEAGNDEHGNQTGPMNGGIVIFSAGNASSNANFYPAYYEPVFAVAASTHTDRIAAYSNYGAWVDITAPGGETYSRAEEGVISTLAGSQYGSFMGTSMACPHVSGVAALTISKYAKAGLHPDALRERLRHSVDNIDGINLGYEGQLGLGRLNASLAVSGDDASPPQQVTDLAIARKDVGEITLTWTSPTDESGFVSSYDIRYSTAPITSGTFTSAIRADNVATPKPPGMTETLTVKNLKGGIVYYFALRSTDFEGNISLISNVVSETGVFTPAISVTPTSITENLRTAQTATRTLTIANNGEGPLKFTLHDASEDDFASAAPEEGTISPGGNQNITVTLDANGLSRGTYTTDYVIANNDPERNSVVVPVTLLVENNNAPIVSVTPSEVDFLSAQKGTTSRKPITVSNDGSDVLIITDVTTTSEEFGADFTGGIQIQPFTDRVLHLTFSPSATGIFAGEVSLHTNDPANPVLQIEVRGEGLNEPPVAVSPASFNETVDKGSIVTRTMTLQNNGSQDRPFSIRVTDPQIVMQEGSSVSPHQPIGSVTDSIVLKQARRVAEHRTAFAAKSPEALALVKPIRGSDVATQTKRNNAGAMQSAEDLEYRTDFEEFTEGSISGQHGWFSTQGWSVSKENPDQGGQHLRGTSMGESYAVSPMVPYVDYEIPRYTSTTMRLNVDNARGASWQVVTQDESFVGNRIRFNADGSIESMVIDNDYENHWRKVPVETPTGYFDLAIEYNNWGSDTSGFPTYHLFINKQHVFSGTGLGFGITQVAVVSETGTSGRTFDMDNLRIFGGEIFPLFVRPSPSEGTIPAGESVEVSMTFDASIMKFGDYKSDIIIDVSETDSLVVPAALRVTGPAEMYVSGGGWIEADKGQPATTQITLMNLGGVAIEFNLEYDLPELNIATKQGVLAVRETRTIDLTFKGPPGMYEDHIILQTDQENIPPNELYLHVTIFDTEAIFSAPDQVHLEIPAGQISTRKIQVINEGENTVTFYTTLPAYSEWLTLDPPSGTAAGQPLDMVMTFDARAASAGNRYTWINFFTNDKELRYHRTALHVTILPDTVNGEKITRDVWTGIPGKTISAIPLGTPPTTTDALRIFESPADEADNYGARVRGYVLPPFAGYYRFWIASNDHSELWLSTDASPESREKIASVTGYTNPRQWEKYATQRSEQIWLEADQKYYIEALHKEGVGTDHLSVGWEIPDGALERPIPGMRLLPFRGEGDNKAPTVTLPTLIEGQIFPAATTIHIEAEAVDEDGTIVKVEFYNGQEKLGVDITAPYQFAWRNVSAGSYAISATAIDDQGTAASASVNIVVQKGAPCSSAGYIQREQWNGIPGTLISSIPAGREPSLRETLSIFESPSNVADNYGARIRGYLCVPVDGAYTFWIASNDKSELWLSTDDNAANKVMIASVSRYTNVRQWTREPSQQSAPVALAAGQKYYIEALHKEGVGSDHLAVGWQLPDGTMERPIPGLRLLPLDEAANHPPVVSIISPADGGTFSAPATVEIVADVSDPDNNVVTVEFFNGTAKLGEDTGAPYSFTWPNVSAGSYTLTAVAVDALNASTASAPVQITVDANCIASGTITREYWSNVTGAQVTDIPVNSIPHGTEYITIFEGPVNAGTNYGARISGYICPPATGDYYFWIASNDHSELWLSIDASAANKVKIASISGATGIRQWDKFASQASVAIALEQGKTYYIEALHKQGVGSDHVAVGWQLPDGTLERPISGSRLSPVRKSGEASARGQTQSASMTDMQAELGDPIIMVYPNPVNGRKLNVTLANFAAIENNVSEIAIRHMTGMSVYSGKVNCFGGCETEIDLHENFRPGIYILQVSMNGRTFTEKLVVK